MVTVKGYYHGNRNSEQNPIVNEWDDSDLNSIMEALYDMDDDIIAALPSLQPLSELLDSIYGTSLKERIKVVIAEIVCLG